MVPRIDGIDPKQSANKSKHAHKTSEFRVKNKTIQKKYNYNNKQQRFKTHRKTKLYIKQMQTTHNKRNNYTQQHKKTKENNTKRKRVT